MTKLTKIEVSAATFNEIHRKLVEGGHRATVAGDGTIPLGGGLAITARTTVNQDLEIVSLLSSKDKTGRVEMRVDDRIVSQWDVKKAKEIAAWIIEAAEAAISDATWFALLTTRLSFDEETATTLIHVSRSVRQGSSGTVNPT